MDYKHVLLEKTEGVAVITLNRPEVLNAMNFQLSYELHDAMMSANADEDVGCIILTGSGHKAFSAGGDIHEQRADAKERTEEEREARSTQRGKWGYELAASPKPTLGMMFGLAHGGGSVLASSLDMRVGCQHAQFRFLAAAYGRINSTWTLPNQVGWPIAKELLFSGRVVEAEEAHRIGLLNHLVPCAELRDKTMWLATMIAKNRREAVMGVKALLLEDLGRDLHEQWMNERSYTTNVVRGAKAESAFPEFIARKGRARS
jgi:enoyl-CoA hydratase